MAATTPATLLGLTDRYGRLAQGYVANFSQIDDRLRVGQIWVEGTPVE
jgi:N-acetylglucosamine-6-phosphate deacetylase